MTKWEKEDPDNPGWNEDPDESTSWSEPSPGDPTWDKDEEKAADSWNEGASEADNWNQQGDPPSTPWPKDTDRASPVWPIPDGIVIKGSPRILAKFLKEEFEETAFRVERASTVRRPDAISPGLIRLTWGPTAVSDTSEGLLARAWKLRVSNEDEAAYLAFAQEDGTWSDETEIFTFTNGDSNPILSIDFTFDQNGAVVFVSERSDGDIWVRYFDITQGGIVFQSKATGRTPVIMLDNPFDDLTSEILLFYLDAGNAVKYLIQSERYGTENDASVALTADDYLEKLVLDTGKRIQLAYSSWDEQAGTWSIDWLSSGRYALEDIVEEFDISGSVASAVLALVLIEHSMEVEEFDISASVVSGLVSLIISAYTDDDTISLALSMSDIVLTEVVTEHTIEVEEFDISGATVSGEITIVVVTYTMIEEEFDIGGSVVSGVLESA